MSMDRFERLLQLPENMYEDEAPVLITKGALLRDTETGKVILQLKFKNIQEKTIKAVAILVTALDSFDQKLGDSIQHQYLDFFAERDDEFGDKDAIFMSDSSARKVEIICKTVLFADGSKWESDGEIWESINGKDIPKAIVFNDAVSLIDASEIDKLNMARSILEKNPNYRNSSELLIKIDKKLDDMYDNAVSAKKKAETEDEFKLAADAFRNIHGFKNADTLSKECFDKAENCRKDGIYNSAKSRMTGEEVASYEEAIKIFQTISGWKDSDEQVCVCHKKIEEIKVKREADRLEEERKAEEQRIAAQKKIIVITTLSVCACIAFVILLTMVIIPKVKSQNLIKALKNISVGDTITFGFYEQDNDTSNGKEEIEWRVLAIEGDKALVISEYALDCQQYNTSYSNVTWEKCSLRSWLNETFYNAAFSSYHQAMIESSNVSADKNPNYSTAPGKDTTDKVFLLSISEVEKYFSSDENRKCVPTKYAIAQGANAGNENCWWWLRSPGRYKKCAANVYGGGAVHYYGYDVDGSSGCVRPALWINIG